MGAHRQRYLQDPGWFGRERGERDLKDIAYFSMEFGLGEALPIYSGGLGILARDLGVPVVGIGLLYQQGYIRKISGLDGRQGEAFPYNDPMALPITPAQIREGGWLRIRLELPGRAIFLRVWHARVGKVTLYLLDSNDLLNSPPDCSATVHLYPAKERVRLRQEIFLGIRGWRMLEKPGLYVEICHLKEGHAAFAVLARNFSFMRQSGHPFPVGLRITGADNVFTPPIGRSKPRSTGFPTNSFAHMRRILRIWYVCRWTICSPWDAKEASNRDEPFNMAFLAMRGSGTDNGVSLLHGAVSRSIFQSLFPNWPLAAGEEGARGICLDGPHQLGGPACGDGTHAGNHPVRVCVWSI